MMPGSVNGWELGMSHVENHFWPTSCIALVDIIAESLVGLKDREVRVAEAKRLLYVTVDSFLCWGRGGRWVMNGPEDDKKRKQRGIFPGDTFPEDVFPEDVFPSDIFRRGDDEDEENREEG